jgi:hypothetical protein
LCRRYESDDSIKIQLAKLTFQNLNFKRLGARPKLPIEIQPGSRPARSFDIPPWITYRVDKELIAAGTLRIFVQALQKLDGRKYSTLFIAVHSGK